MAPDGTDRRAVPSQIVGKITSFSWAPDSRNIAYEYGEWPYGGIFRTVSVATQGAGPVYLVPFELYPGKPVWSPRGDRIAVTISVTGDAEIYTVRATNGGDRRNITNNPSTDLISDWK
jgi:Tol biopolymer transport system component